MDRVKAQDHVEKLAEDLVLLDVSQPQAFLKVSRDISHLLDFFADNDEKELAAKNVAIRSLLEESGKGLLPLESALEPLFAWISEVQHVLCHGLDAAKIIIQAQEAEDDNGPLPLSPIVDERILGEFLTRQEFVIDDLEALLLALERNRDSEAMHRAKRILHTLKGESSLLGMSQVEHLCHAMEDALALLRFDVLFEAKDWLGKAFQHYAGKAGRPIHYASLLQRLVNGAEVEATTDHPQSQFGGEIPEMVSALFLQEGTDAGLVSDFLNESNEHLEAADLHLMKLETDPSQLESVNAVFRAFHTIKGLAGFLELMPVRILAHESESLLDLLRSGSVVFTPAVSDVLFQAVDQLRKLISLLDASATGQMQIPLRKLVISVQAAARGETKPFEKANELTPSQSKPAPAAKPATQASPGALAGERRPAGSEPMPPLDLGAVSEELGSGEATPALRAQSQGAVTVRETVKVEADRLDRLLDTIGEMVIAEAMVVQSPELHDKTSPLLRQRLVQLDKITRHLQELGTSLRMVPIRPVFQKMARLARDLSRKCDKPLDFIAIGEAVEIDKTVVDKIADPLVHMVRNAVDHGIEASPEDRVRAGKDATAKIKLSAFQKGGSICIELEEDGRGLNRQAILKKAQAAGLIQGDGSNLEDREVWPFIFAPGFSTAAQVTEVSGRGVGMDVVKRTIEDLRGRIDIQTQPGKGTRFSIWLPLTMAIIDGMVVRVGRERCIFPTLSVVTILSIKDSETVDVMEHGQLISHQGRQIPVFPLEMFFGDEKPGDDQRRIAVLVEAEGKIFGFAVDELLGKQQIVIKSLGDTFKSIPGLAGGGILSDGNVGLILDVDGLAKAVTAPQPFPSALVNEKWALARSKAAA